MSKSFLRIDTIKNLAVYKDFQWDNSILDDKNTVVDFKKINIFYGHNYSGKTTLSRIFRALETGSISEKYGAPEFHLSLDDGTKLTQELLSSHEQIIRVFNKDFVKENLHFIADDEKHSINSFAILGENNTKIEQEINQLEDTLGSEEKKTGLFGCSFNAQQNFNQDQKLYDERSKKLEDQLRNKANDEIKHNKTYGDANYNVTKIKSDINEVSKSLYKSMSDDEQLKARELLKEEPKQEIPKSQPFKFKYSSILSEAKQLIEKKIQPSAPIQELINDAMLAEWVRTGRGFHEQKRETCAFCGHELTQGLWEKLDKHFNQESEELRNAINVIIRSIEEEQTQISQLLKIKSTNFYSKFAQAIGELQDRLSENSDAYSRALDSIKSQLEKRKNNIFTVFELDEPISVESVLIDIQRSYEELREQSNQLTASLSSDQRKARNELRLHEVFTFITDIKYDDERNAIDLLEKAKNEAESKLTDAKNVINIQQKRIRDLKSQLKDESKGAERVNDYLNNFFGHHRLTLKAIKEESGALGAKYRFEIWRDNKKAYHLSEGECSLIAFCYFIAKLDDIETKGNQPIIWIDDPISSLDSNHIFFIYSLINSEILTHEKDRPERYKQLFISTHNLHFLKYLKRLPGAAQDERKNEKNKEYRHFVIERQDSSSTIKLMPRYLREYVTEFNYLFEQIYKCATIEMVNDQNYTTFYNFGNNTRKFLEIYLYYKYPDHRKEEEKLEHFFGEGKVPVILTDRINNEYSHLAGVFERGATPVEAPEMKKTATFIIEKIQEKDPDQYKALLQSIGVTDTSIQ